MLIHVSKRFLTKQRIRLLFLTTGACLLLTGYILTFIRLESLVKISESDSAEKNGQQFKYGVQYLCRETMARDRLWRHAAANVLIKRNWMTGDDMGLGRDVLNDKKQNLKGKNDWLFQETRPPVELNELNVRMLRNKRSNIAASKYGNDPNGNIKNSENFLKTNETNDRNAVFNLISGSSSNDNLFDKFQNLMDQICQEYSTMIASDENIENSPFYSNTNTTNNIKLHQAIDIKNIPETKPYDTDNRQELDASPTSKAPESDLLLDDEQIQFLIKTVEMFGKRRRESIGDTDFYLKMKRKRIKARLEIHKPHKSGEPLPNWKIFQSRISSRSLYDDDDSADGNVDPSGMKDATFLKDLLRDLEVRKIASVDEMSELGTQIKYIFTLDNGNRAIFKPKRTARDSEETMDIYYMYEKERHTSEIASFHLDRILGFRRVPPASGRNIDMINELQVHLSSHARKKFYLSPVGNQCFFGKCLYLCDPAHAVCGNGRILEGSLVTFLPNKSIADWSSFQNPWARSYSKYSKSFWEKDPNGTKICARVRQQSPFHQWYPLLNLIDIHIFDFLTGNKDRHHIHFFEMFGNTSNYVLIDNGKGFGRYSNDIIDILAPLYQCCLIRYTTLRTLVQLHTDPHRKLSQLMKESLSRDVLPDILTPAHLRALDRRVRIILEEVLRCLSRSFESSDVIIDDDIIDQSENSINS